MCITFISFSQHLRPVLMKAEKYSSRWLMLQYSRPHRIYIFPCSNSLFLFLFLSFFFLFFSFFFLTRWQEEVRLQAKGGNWWAILYCGIWSFCVMRVDIERDNRAWTFLIVNNIILNKLWLLWWHVLIEPSFPALSGHFTFTDFRTFSAMIQRRFAQVLKGQGRARAFVRFQYKRQHKQWRGSDSKLFR